MTTHIDNHWPRRVSILGVGLLGGSVALSIRRNRPDVVLVGSARDSTKCARLTAAGIVDEATTSIDTACQDVDVVVVATPVDRIVSMVIEAAKASPRDCLITDVGSTKAQIVEQVNQHPAAARKFVAAHPIAGSEKTGFEHARADLFDGKVVVITPTDQNDLQQVKKANDFWQWIGGEIHTMSAAEHDTHLASISHVPHLVSALVSRMATDQSRPLAGSGWQDITRVAAGDPAMWTAICRQNRAAILAELDRLSGELNQLRQTLDQTDSAAEGAIYDWLAEAKRIKEQS
jgi:prephenate dehydrogenase